MGNYITIALILQAMLSWKKWENYEGAKFPI